MSVATALATEGDRVVRAEERFHLVEQVLEGRWLTFRSPGNPRAFDPGVDLHPLAGLTRREGIALERGGSLYSQNPRFWTGPDGWAPAGDVLSLRLTGGTAEVQVVEVDEEARERGLRLADRVMSRVALPDGLSADTMDKQARALLGLLAEDPRLLREPVAPLSSFLPRAPEPRTTTRDYDDSWPPSVQISLAPRLCDRLLRAADADDLPLAAWLTAEISRMASWPGHNDPSYRSAEVRRTGHYLPHDYPDDDFPHGLYHDDPYEYPDDGWTSAAAPLDR